MALGDQVKWSCLSWSGTDRRVICSLACFFCWGSKWRKPLWTRGEHANSTQKGPGDSPPEHWRRTCPQYQQRPMRESNPGPSCCEAPMCVCVCSCCTLQWIMWSVWLLGCCVSWLWTSAQPRPSTRGHWGEEHNLTPRIIAHVKHVYNTTDQTL